MVLFRWHNSELFFVVLSERVVFVPGSVTASPGKEGTKAFQADAGAGSSRNN